VLLNILPIKYVPCSKNLISCKDVILLFVIIDSFFYRDICITGDDTLQYTVDSTVHVNQCISTVINLCTSGDAIIYLDKEGW
jgi:hypothetical protein